MLVFSPLVSRQKAKELQILELAKALVKFATLLLCVGFMVSYLLFISFFALLLTVSLRSVLDLFSIKFHTLKVTKFSVPSK